MNNDTIESYKKLMQDKSKEELITLLSESLYHLQVLSGSRNSFSQEWMQEMYENEISFPKRDNIVESMHQEAYRFLKAIQS